MHNLVHEFSPVFIVGSSRSGTTMMNRILGKNKEVSALNELHFIGDIWDIALPLTNLSRNRALELASILLMHIRRGFWDGGVSASEIKTAEEVIAVRDDWNYREIYEAVLRLEMKGDRKFVTDQTPRNVFFVDFILEVFPNARIIHMVRDPRAVLYSQRNRWKKKWLGASSMPLKNVLRVLSNYHPYTISNLWKIAAMIAIKNKATDRYKVVVFEELVLNPELEIKRVCSFLNLDFNESMLAVPQVGSSNKMHDRQKIGISSDVVDSWKEKLPKGDTYICESVLTDYLSQFGYSKVGNRHWLYYTIGSMLRFPFHIAGSILFNANVIYIHIKAMVKLK